MLKVELHAKVGAALGIGVATVTSVHNAILELYYKEMEAGECHVHGIGVITAFDCKLTTPLVDAFGQRQKAREGRKYARIRTSKKVKRAVNGDVA